MKLICLSCNKKFESKGIFNRICKTCKKRRRYEEVVYYPIILPENSCLNSEYERGTY